jgi:uncharacterized membrane protein
MFETRLGLRMDYEACLAYLLLPPAGPVVLLMLEHRSDYVRFVNSDGPGGRLPGLRTYTNMDRFHAWQASLLFAFIFIIHIIFSWSSIISWLLLVGDLGLIGFLTMHAYQDGKSILILLSSFAHLVYSGHSGSIRGSFLRPDRKLHPR